MKRRYQFKPHHHYHRPRIWCKIRAICLQIFIPLIFFQFIRMLFLPTTFDIILFTLMVVFYCCLRLRLF